MVPLRVYAKQDNDMQLHIEVQNCGPQGGTVLVHQDPDIRPGLEPRVSPLDTLAIRTSI